MSESTRRGVSKLVELPAGPGLVAGLGAVAVADLSANEAITYLQQVNRAVAWLSGVQAQARKDVTERVVQHFAAEADGHVDAPFMAAELRASAEIAAATRLSPRASDARIQESYDLTGPWRLMQDALLAGDVSLDHVRAVGRELHKAPGYGNSAESARYAKTCTKVLATVVPFAVTHSPGSRHARPRC